MAMRPFPFTISVFLSFVGFTFQSEAQGCSALPPTVHPGGTATLLCQCPSTTGWTASAGSVTVSGRIATFHAIGIGPGPVTLVAQCAGMAQPQRVVINVDAFAAAPAPQPLSLCSISFERDKRRPTRVDNEARACLDDVDLSLERNSDSTLMVIGGDAALDTAAGSRRAQQRAVNTKDYLVRQKGVDSSRIQLRVEKSARSNVVQMQLLPAGAQPSDNEWRSVDETKIKPIPRDTDNH